MNYIKLLSLPQVLYAHRYQAESYQKHFDTSDHTMEITYIAEGSFFYTLGAESFTVKKGDVLCTLRDQKTSVLAKAFHQHHTVVAEANRTFTKDAEALLLPPVTPAEYHTEKIYRLIDELVYHEVHYKTAKEQGAAKFLELLCAIDQCNRKHQQSNLPGEQLYAERAKRYVQENIHQTITQQAIANHLGVSPEYLCTVFKKAEGTTLMRYINRLKLENVKSLMDNASLHLYEAAALYGYNNPDYVSKLYKQLFGHNITDHPSIHPQYEEKQPPK